MLVLQAKLEVPRTIDEVISNLNDFDLTCMDIPVQARYAIIMVVQGAEESVNAYVEHMDAEFIGEPVETLA